MRSSDIDIIYAYIWPVKSYLNVKSFGKRLYNQDFFALAFTSLCDLMVCFDIKSELAVAGQAFTY